ncbi:LOW QUALITY PROTEIN: actin cytoskeleton-regulatory complex protein PAN1, partial [Plectropomus leopardus]|uniref:LOW QUALITY PROTEIN: actin cytoskeleton-regulatory complex protein PAN1 n=1 Tax=Plectropomus leopardus TaxID=160734 RepID=UPI001C4B2FAD
LKVGGVPAGLRSKPRFSFSEVKLLLEAVKRNRYILLRKFNHGVSAEAKKRTWLDITSQVNGLGENHREVRQIMKKWADLKCDAKRRMVALRSPNGSNLRKKNLGPVERMVHKILMMSPRGDCDSDLDFAEDDDFSKLYSKGPPPPRRPTPTSTSLTTPSPGPQEPPMTSLLSPRLRKSLVVILSTPPLTLTWLRMENVPWTLKKMTTPCSPPMLPLFLQPPPPLDPLPDNTLLRMKPVHTYSRNNSQNHTSSRTPPGPSSSAASTSSAFPSVSDSDAALSSVAPLPSQSPTSSNVTASSLPAPSSSLPPPPPPPTSSSSAAANTSTSNPAPSSSSFPPPPAPPTAVSSSSAAPTATSSSNSHRPPPPPSSVPLPNHASTSSSNPTDPLPAGAPSHRERVAQMASQSLQQQRASRMLLTSVSQSLEMLAQSVQLLVESQQEFVQESLLLQRETVDVLRDFSNTALTMLRDKANSGQLAAHHHPAAHF